MESFSLEDISHTDAAAKWILDQMDKRDILLLEGPMGAGKTTLASAICNALGCTDKISSPTYSIIQEYMRPGGSVYHVDLYRLRDMNEAYDAGVEEVLHSGQWCIVEWPEKILPLLPESYTRVAILTDNHKRLLQLENYG